MRGEEKTDFLLQTGDETLGACALSVSRCRCACGYGVHPHSEFRGGMTAVSFVGFFPPFVRLPVGLPCFLYARRSCFWSLTETGHQVPWRWPGPRAYIQPQLSKVPPYLCPAFRNAIFLLPNSPFYCWKQRQFCLVIVAVTIVIIIGAYWDWNLLFPPRIVTLSCLQNDRWWQNFIR